MATISELLQADVVAAKSQLDAVEATLKANMDNLLNGSVEKAAYDSAVAKLASLDSEIGDLSEEFMAKVKAYLGIA